MGSKHKRRAPEIILREGKPAAVILDIDEYQDMLERLEDTEDLRMLAEMRKKPLQFRSLDDFLSFRAVTQCGVAVLLGVPERDKG